MAANIEEITREVIDLPRHQRMALIRLLLDLDQPGTSEGALSGLGLRCRVCGPVITAE